MEAHPTFLKVLSTAKLHCNDLHVPHLFCLKYGSRIPATVKLIIRTGYEIWLDFDKAKEKFVGFRKLIGDFGLRGGSFLIFEYIGGFDFRVCIMAIDSCEIKYPLKVHEMQDSRPMPVSITRGGWSFVSNRVCCPAKMDVVDVPSRFVREVGNVIVDRVEVAVSAGYVVVCKFNRKDLEISGLASVCNMLGFPHLNCFKLLLFTFDGVSRFTLSAFDAAKVNIPVFPIHCEEAIHYVIGETAFDIVVQEFHMNRYCHGVDVSVEFKDVRWGWDNIDFITAYVGTRCWTLQVRRRRDLKRVTIHDGWLQFRKDLKLGVGDLCVFQWKNDTVRNFEIRIEKAVIELDSD